MTASAGERALRWIAPLLVAFGIVATVLMLDPLDLDLLTGENATGSGAAVPVREQTEIAVASLSTTTEVDGDIGPVARRPVHANGSGTVTSLTDVGDGIEPGTVLFAVDGVPTVALPGSVPAWRPMSIDTVGVDVAQLEAALTELGFDPDGAMTVDDTYTSATAAAVEAWQADVGLDVTGTVGPSSVAFVPPDTRVVSVEATVGQTVVAGGAILEVATTERELAFSLEAEQLAGITVGSTVSFRLPDRSTFDAVITDIVSDGSGSWTITGRIDEGAPLPDGDLLPVTVSWSYLLAEDVATVPAGALTRLDSGIVVVEVVEPGGATRFVEVGVGASSGSTVEIITDLAPGTTVIG